MRILLLGNYLNDRQESMLRFAGMLERGLTQRGHQVCKLYPEPLFGALRPAAHGTGKWLGYLDKFLFFPRALRAMARWADVVHICDHSNAFYTSHLKGLRVPTLVTCHDLLAVRGALGEETDCPASPTGKILQRWILNGLRHARSIACVSSYTREDVERLVGHGPRVRIVPNGLHHPYQVIPADEADARLRSAGIDPSEPFILHVGSGQRRKNRDGVIRIFERVQRVWDGKLIFAGQPLSEKQMELVRAHGLAERVIQICNADNALLEALYNRAHALLFPSRFEGFGWPILEAQGCGCPVICSDRCSFPEVGGVGALYRDVEDEAGFANDILRLCDPDERNKWVARGLQNVRGFAADKMVDQYVRLYEEELSARTY